MPQKPVFAVAVFSVLFSAAPLQAQPISWGMAQCSGIMEVMSTHMRRPALETYLVQASVTFMEAAARQSSTEGRDATELPEVREAKAAEWRKMGLTLAVRREFYDWMDYCASLGRAYDITLDRGMLD